jgi:hypothetical protein
LRDEELQKVVETGEDDRLVERRMTTFQIFVLEFGIK